MNLRSPGHWVWRQVTFLLSCMVSTSLPAVDVQGASRGRELLAFDSFEMFAKTNSTPEELILASPRLQSRQPFNQAIISWNALMPTAAVLVVEARVFYGDTPTRYFGMGAWSTDTNLPSTSLPNQKDQYGEVDTDTLKLASPAQTMQVRIKLKGPVPSASWLRLVTVCTSDTAREFPPLEPEKRAWGKTVPVPERTQMIYPNGKTLCSPTTTSMLLAYWAAQKERKDWDFPVPVVAARVYDQNWRGTGNWVFNMAFAGSQPGIRAYVTRFSDISELEEWISRGLPVGMSLDYDRLRGIGPGPNGHLLVCVGFSDDGEVIVNDPGTTKNVRKKFSRQRLQEAWACSQNTVYLVYPEGTSLPEDKYGHWASKKPSMAQQMPWKL